MLLLTGAQVLDYNQKSKFFGEIFRYQNEANLTIRGLITTLTNTSGISGIDANIQNYFNTDNDYSSIIINGYNFGSGKIHNVSFSTSNDVQQKTYTISLTCFQSGNLFNLTGTSYTGTQNNPLSPYYLIDNFDEKFDYSKNGEKLDYVHSVSLRFNSGDNIGNSPIQKAQILAQQLLYANTPFGFLITGENTGVGKMIYNENYDAITNQCSFQQTYQRDTITNGSIYYLTDSFELSANGIVTATETARMEDLLPYPNPQTFNNLAIEMAALIAGSFGRCSGMYSLYSGIAYPLFTGYTTLSQNINSFTRIGNYTVSFTNNPAQVTGGFSWTYVNQLDKDVQYYNISENGKVVGHGNPITRGLGVAQSIFNNVVQTGLYTRCNNFYIQEIVFPLTLNQISQSIDSSIFEGSVSYSTTFTDNPDYNVIGYPLIRNANIAIDNNFPVLLINKFELPNFAEIVQPTNNATLALKQVDLKLVGARNSYLNDMKNYALAQFNSLIPSGGLDPFLNKAQYSYNPITKEFTANAAWWYQTGAYSGIT